MKKTKKQKICFFGNFSGGGTERACFKLANKLLPYFDIYILNNTNRNPSFSLDKKIHFSFLKGNGILKRTVSIYKFLKKNKIEYLISLEAMSGIYSLIPSKLAHCKFIVWEHANFFQTQGSKHIQKVRRIELKLADAYVVLTERDKKNFETNFKVNSKITNIYNIIDEQPTASYNIESKNIISAGYIRPIKQFDIIPDVAKKVFSKHPDWKWYLCGNDQGKNYEALLSKVKRYNLENHIIFRGRCDNMSEEYSKSAMYVMTSLQEGLPMVLLESKAHKLPIVSFDIETGPDEIIDDGVNGFLIEPYSIEKMAKKINLLIEDEDLRKQFSDDSKIGIEKFDKDVITEKWKNLLESI